MKILERYLYYLYLFKINLEISWQQPYVNTRNMKIMKLSGTDPCIVAYSLITIYTYN